MSVKTHLTKTDASAFKTRWAMVNRAERMELRATTMHRKFRQLAALMASVEKFSWAQPLAQEESEVRIRWNMLRKAKHLA
jgi:hypothetical protein